MTDLLITRSARLSPCRTLRFTLERRWGEGPLVCFCGVNPATADEHDEDRTDQRWQHFARAWGFAGYIGVNPIPRRTPDPDAALAWLASGQPEVMPALLENLPIAAAAIAGAPLFVACWGDVPWAKPYLAQLLTFAAALRDRPLQLHCLGTTKNGSPIHPMARGRSRVPDDAKPILWEGAKA